MEYGQYVYNFKTVSGHYLYNNGETNRDGDIQVKIQPGPNFFWEEDEAGNFLHNNELVKHDTQWKELGVQGPIGLIFKVNNFENVIGPTRTYELSDYNIKSFVIPYTESNKALLGNIIIDYGYVEV